MSSNIDIFNRPPDIAGDTVQYTLYPSTELSDKTSATSLAACLLKHAEDLTGENFIWHKDPFELRVVPDTFHKDQWVLEGTMRVGDCVDDEWCMVWLLRQISERWDLAISIFDSDGEFLLIEAAESLPTWVQPSNSENRVWIYKSRIHLIPIVHVSSPSRKRVRRRFPGSSQSDDEDENDLATDEYLMVDDALVLIRDPSIETLAPPVVEDTIWKRINQYPAASRQHIHCTNVYVPIDIARALSKRPHLVQKAVETFYTRDSTQLRAAHRMSRFPPGTSVLTTINMTRPAYAQLVGQKFFPPKVFGSWQEKDGSNEYRWRDVGMKIAVGFEMLYQESKASVRLENPTAEGLESSTEAKRDALGRNPEYTKFLENLVSAGYFRGEIQGSQLWNTLENKSIEAFLNSRREDNATRQTFAAIVTAAVSEAGSSFSPVMGEEESDSWLDIDSETFESFLEKSIRPPRPQQQDGDSMVIDENVSPEDRIASQQASRLKDLAEKVEQFIERDGDMDGAKVSNDEDDSGDSDDAEFSDDPSSDSESEASDPAERQAAMDRLVPGLEPQEYGRMPAKFHANSQRTAPEKMDTDAPLVEDTAPSPSKTPRQPILTRERYDGVDSDDETDDEAMDPESEEDQPQVVGDIEVDMGEEEEEFLEFSRQALGISNEQWEEIVKERKGRGAFVPTPRPLPFKLPEKEPKPEPPKLNSSGRNPNLDSFEAVMAAMDAELARVKASKTPEVAPMPSDAKAKDKGKGKAREMSPIGEDDLIAAMDEELKSVLNQDYDNDGSDGEDGAMDYGLIKNFLESYKSQAGLSGPVSNLAGMLQPGFFIPRDES